MVHVHGAWHPPVSLQLKQGHMRLLGRDRVFQVTVLVGHVAYRPPGRGLRVALEDVQVVVLARGLDVRPERLVVGHEQVDALVPG